VLLALATPAQGQGYHAHTPIGNALNGTGYRTLPLRASDLVRKPPPTLNFNVIHIVRIRTNHIYIKAVVFFLSAFQECRCVPPLSPP
jgi:hypothetical protein